jgi:hypothetical protein
MGHKNQTKAEDGRIRAWTYVAEEGPRSGFSLSGWKAERPRKPAAHLLEPGPEPELCCRRRPGQSLTYMVARNSATHAAIAPDTSHGDHRR